MAWHRKVGVRHYFFFSFYSGNGCRLFGHPFQVNVSSVQENGTVIGVVGNPGASSGQGFWQNSKNGLHLINTKWHKNVTTLSRKETPKIILACSQEFEMWMRPICTSALFRDLVLVSVSPSPFCAWRCFTEGLQWLGCCCLLNVCKIKCNVWERPDTWLGSASWLCLCSSVKSK